MGSTFLITLKQEIKVDTLVKSQDWTAQDILHYLPLTVKIDRKGLDETLKYACEGIRVI